MISLAAVLLLQPAAPVTKPESPFNGRDLAGWAAQQQEGKASRWRVGRAVLDPSDPARFAKGAAGRELLNDTEWGKSVNLYTVYRYGDIHLSLEVFVPKNSNSGIYLMGEYEIQVLDSFGRDAGPGDSDFGAIYGAKPPTRPKYKAPGEWNTVDVYFSAPKFDASGRKTASARFHRIVINGRIVQENVELSGPTPGGLEGKEKAEGPLMFQGDHGPVAFRSIRIKKWTPGA